jgi:hypothetical protein
MGRKPKIRSLTILGRRWFNKVNGNTYFSAVGLINGEEKARIDFRCGCKNQYVYEIGEELCKNGIVKLKKYNAGDHGPLWIHCRDNDIVFYTDVVDVSRKKDL